MKQEGFYKLSIKDRQKLLTDEFNFSKEEIQTLGNSLPIETADKMAENVVGTFSLPYGLAMNFKINGEEKIVPMATEEPSVIAAASNAAKLCLPEGFKASASLPIMIGQIQVIKLNDANFALKTLLKEKKHLLEIANSRDSTLVKLGGGAKDLQGKVLETKRGKMLSLQVLVDCRDAMGANAVNTICELLSPEIEKITGGKVRLRIISNLAIHRTVKVTAVWKKELLSEPTIEAILDSHEFALNDVFRATTNNKGVMNGISAVCLATGNDTRALEAGAHSYASYKNNGKYLPLANYSKNKSGDLVGELEMPLAVGIVGGATKTHPLAKLSLKILQVKSAVELAQIMTCVGLANNFAAIRALSTEGIQRGHMELHARNIAVAAGAKGAQIDQVANKMVLEKNIRLERAKEMLNKK
ncbi:hydroxymethylglutaryl-CoA reductase, degradative [Candidatus Micrarchaeota archaeon]|nr:hydroxymethylglutaryl-CoA reductase, degradative [Candidatus Micrarchaeota archaeon]